MYSWGVGTPQSDHNLKKKFFFLIKALRWFLILFLYFVHFVVATKVFGMQHFSLSLSLSMYVLHMCEYSWFQKHALFYFLSFTVGNWVCCTHCWLSPQHLLPSPSSAVPDFHLGIWGSRDADSTSISRSCHHSAGKSCLWLFLFSFRVKKKQKTKKQQSRHTGAARLDAVGPCYPASSPTASHPSVLLFTAPSYSSWNIPGTAISANILPPLGL